MIRFSPDSVVVISDLLHVAESAEEFMISLDMRGIPRLSSVESIHYAFEYADDIKKRMIVMDCVSILIEEENIGTEVSTMLINDMVRSYFTFGFRKQYLEKREDELFSTWKRVLKTVFGRFPEKTRDSFRLYELGMHLFTS